MTAPQAKPRRVGFLQLAALCALALLVLRTAFAAEAARAFDIPADVAEKSLKAFSAQSGLPILFASASAGKRRTNEIKGSFAPRDALNRLLEGTGLVVMQPEANGPLTITRESNGADAARTNSKDRSKANDSNSSAKKKSEIMTKPTTIRRPAGWLGRLIALASAATSFAQTTPPSPTSETPIELSPFVVNSGLDTGYQATLTLAGTRLNTPLKDLGASISIYTKDFLNDIGATSSTDLLVYATGMEAAGAGGNYSGAADDINAATVVGNAPRVDPQGSSRARGLAAPNFTRGFFATGIAFDSYNTETATVNRGPNAILFGVGSPAGVVDTALIRPDLRRDRNKVELRYGSNDSVRSSVDFNRILIKNRLAMRLAGLDDREEFNQRPAFEEKKRIYGALAYEPFRSTSLRANFESGHTRANRPITVLPFNSSAPWMAGGRQGFDWTYYDDPSRNPNAAAQSGGAEFRGPLVGEAQIFDSVMVVYANPSANSPTAAFRPQLPSTGANAADAVKNQIFHPLVNRDLAADSIVFLGTFNIAELPALYWTGANVPPGQLPGFVPAGIKTQGFTDGSVFDFRNRMIDESSRQGESFHAFNVALEQRGWRDRIGVELAYDAQRVDRRGKNAFFGSGSTTHIRVDPNVTLATGQPNPNYGRPYATYGQTVWSNVFSEREAKRATGYIKYDFKDLGAAWAKWLGRHTATGLYEENAVETINYGHRLATDGDAARAITPNVNVFPRRPSLVVYLGPSFIGNNNPLQFQPIQVPELKAGPLPAATYFVRSANATDPGAFVSAPASLVEINGGGNAQREVIKSQAAVLQSYWLRDHLVTLFGWRRDEDYFVRNIINYVRNPADSNDPGKVHFGFDDFSFPDTPPPNVAKETKSYSVVLHWPQTLLRLPAGSGVSVFYNKSENFTPLGGRINAFHELQPSPKGRTEEFGLSSSVFNDKLQLRVNRFETAVTGQSFTPGVFGTAINNGTLQMADVWVLEGNINPHLVAMRNADIELLFSALPANFRRLYDFQVTGAAPNLAVSRLPLAPGTGDTTDYTAKGMEIEVVYNPTSNWRILANVAKQETVQSNSLPFLKRYIALMKPIWEQLSDRPRQNYPLGWQPGDPVTFQTLGEWINANVMVPFATATATEGSASAEQRKWRVNLVTNYSFGRDSIFGDRLKGWGIGGALRWQDKVGIGYPTRRNADTSVAIDIAHPYYAPPETNVDAWVSYGRELWKDRIKWKVQLNVRNLIADTAPIAIGVQPWGEISTVRLAPERRWYLTNTFSF